MADVEFANCVKEIVECIPEKYHYRSMETLLRDDQELIFKHKHGMLLYLMYTVETYGSRCLIEILHCDPVRNQSLVDKVQALKKEYKRLFVVAGQAHFVGNRVFGVQTDDTGTVVENYLHTKKYIVLEPRENISQASQSFIKNSIDASHIWMASKAPITLLGDKWQIC